MPKAGDLRRLPAAAEAILFSDLALREAATIRPSAAQFAKRDAVKGTVLSIDGPSTRDLDNAISFRQQRDGSVIIGIHATDLSSVIRVGSALDYSARIRSETLYMENHGLTAFMIPKSLAEGTLSLFEGQPRLTKSVEMKFSPDGKLLGSRIFNSKLINRYQLTPDTATQAMNGQGRAFRRPEIQNALKSLTAIAGKALSRGAPGAGPAAFDDMLAFFTQRSARIVGEALSAAKLETSFRNQLDPKVRSQYGHTSQGHAALQAKAYVRWTSPMRNYAALEAQRAMDRQILGIKPDAAKVTRERAMRELQHERANGDTAESRREGIRALVSFTRYRRGERPRSDRR